MLGPCPRNLLLLLLGPALLTLGGCRADVESTPHASPELAPPALQTVPLREYQEFVSSPDHWQFTLSPSGERVAYSKRVDGGEELWLWSAADDSHDQLLAAGAVRGSLSDMLWLPDGERLLCLSREVRVEVIQRETAQGAVQQPVQRVTERLYLVQPGQDPVDLTLAGEPRIQLLAVDSDLPGVALIGVEDVVPGLFDAALLDVTTGEIEVIYEPGVGTARLLIGSGLQILAEERLAKRNYFNERALLGNEAILPRQEFPLMRWVDLDFIRSQALWADDELRTVLAKDSRGRDAAAVVRTDLTYGFPEVIWSRPGVDAGEVLLDEETGLVQAVSYELGTTKWDVLDPRLESDFALLEQRFPYGFDIDGRARGDDAWLISAPNQHGIVEAYHFVPGSSQVKPIASSHEALRSDQLGRLETFSFTARDGAVVHGYLTLPPNLASSADLADAPMVLVVNPKPWERPHFRYDALRQWLANHGYVAVMPAARGVSGFGKSFEREGYADIDGKILTDHIDAGRWLIEQGWTSRQQLAIMGYSVSGALAQVAFGKAGDVFAAGANLFGPLNFSHYLEVVPREHPMREFYAERIGDPIKEPRALAEASPVAHLASTDRPFFFARRFGDAMIYPEDRVILEGLVTYQNVQVTEVVARARQDGSLADDVRAQVDKLLASFLAFVLGGRAEPIWESQFGEQVWTELDAGYLLWEDPSIAPTEMMGTDAAAADDDDDMPLELPDSPG